MKKEHEKNNFCTFNTNKMREYNSFSFSYFPYIITFLITIQPCTLMSRSSDTGFVTAAASVKSPGEMDPKSLSILIGGDANITCRLTKPNSFDIWFIEEKSKRPIKQPSDEIERIDQYTAVLMIRNAVEQNSRYQCKVGDYAIGESELYVGTKPSNVTDFACISYDYEYMECSFTRPKNMVLTRFDLEYRLPKDNSVYKCHCHEVDNHKLKCNVTDYLPMRETYLFTLKGTNDVGENIQHFSINNHKIVIPSAVDIVKQNVTSDSIALSLEKLKISYYIKIGLTYDIQIRDNNSDWQTPQMGELECQNGICNILINNLYAFWLYWIKVRVKSNAVDNDNFWSDQSVLSFRTESVRPKRAPETPLGGFYIDSTETQLRLYWEQMPMHEHNGPGFHYVINEWNGNGVAILRTKVNESSATFLWKNESMQMFTIKSANDIGESTVQNVIRAYRRASSRYELNENSIAKVYHNRSYTLSWSPPENTVDLMNYTVFWCLPKIELPNQCKGPISYKYLDKSATNFTTEPKDRSLNLAISANYRNYNKGMQWARCSGDISSELMKMELEVNALNESAILVKWSSGSVCASILKGYNLTYCQASADDKCVSPAFTVELLRKKQEYRNYTISDIPPYTNVCLYMFMYSSSKQGRISDLNCIRTKASAPSPPRNVRYIKNTITSKSAEIQWSPPEISNGVLRHYTVYWRKYPDQTFEKNTTSINQTSYNLTGLNSYSNYEVYVTAHTIEESLASSHINFTTLIGIPSGPRNLTIFENDTVIYWDQPDLPSGRHLFYVVALISRDENFNAAYERVSIVKGRSCRFQQPDCLNSNKSYGIKVRAVNVGNMEEVDGDIIAMNKDVILAGAPIDENFCESDEENGEYSLEINSKSIFQNDKDKFYFASPWIVAPRSYSCSVTSKASIYGIALIIVVAFAAYLCFWLRSKYYKMKNIKVILPEGLVEQVSNYKFATSTLSNGSNLVSSAKKEFHSNISRSNDYLVPNNNKENDNLITNFHSTNASASLSSSNTSREHHNEEQSLEHPSLETTNEELSTTSSSSANSNISVQNNQKIRRISSFDSSSNTIPVSACEIRENNDGNDGNVHSLSNENTKNCITQQNNGYVTHNSQLLASILSGTERNIQTTSHFNTTFPTMANDGYIQPSVAKQLFQPSFSHQQPQPATSLTGYTCIESISKLTAPEDIEHTNNISTSQSFTNLPLSSTKTLNKTPVNADNTIPPVVQTNILSSSLITDLHESPSTDYMKDSLPPVGTTVPTVNASQQPNNNSTSIYGYVTQQQLASFGTNVALGK